MTENKRVYPNGPVVSHEIGHMFGIALAFSLVPGFIALLKAAALLIYPLNQKRVSQIEKELAARRAGASPQTKTV